MCFLIYVIDYADDFFPVRFRKVFEVVLRPGNTELIQEKAVIQNASLCLVGKHCGRLKFI